MSVSTRMRSFSCVVAATLSAIATVSVAQTHPVGKTCPKFVVTDAYRNKIDVERQKNKVVFINFWALTCIPCKMEMPGINALRLRYKGDTNFLVLPVDLDHNFPASMQYMANEGFQLGVYTPVSAVPEVLFQGELPTTAVIDKKGNIAFFHKGEDRYDSPAFFQLIDSLLRW